MRLRIPIPAEPSLLRRWKVGAGLLGAGAALVVGGAAALSVQVVQLSPAGSSSLGPGLSFSFPAASFSTVAFYCVLGVLPLLSLMYPRAAWLGFGVSVLLGLFAVAYTLGGFSAIAVDLAWVIFVGALLNGLGSLVLRRPRERRSLPVPAGAHLVRKARIR